MNFTPRTREDIDKDNLLPDGIYDFDVQKATDTKSSKGNDMIEAQLKFFGPDREYLVFDYLMAKMPRKLIDFCDATGLASRYNAGEIDAETIEGRSGKAELRTEPATAKWKAKNVVFQYIPREAAGHVEAPAAPSRKTASKKVAGPDDDDIPF